MSTSIYSLLDRRREGKPWSGAEIRGFIDGFMAGEIADYQMTAFLMAVAIHGATEEESRALTEAMLASGAQWSLRDEIDFVGDKHSTGGVGDKISLVMSPWLASVGVPIAMLSGRGLGHTGGTLDKLEAIPGFDAGLDRRQVLACLEKVGCAIATSTTEIAPADRRLYALRDVTGTVRSIPLITASIMSKKLAMGASALVLDVKVGRGAFMREPDDARELARALIAAGEGSGTKVSALLSNMDQPLGRAIGNANEVAEAFAVLRGEGPADLFDLSLELSLELMEAAGRERRDADKELRDAIASGRATEAAERWIEAQGGDPRVVTSSETLPRPHRTVEITADRAGFVSDLDPLALAELTVALGAGRRVQTDEVDHAVGLDLAVERGERVGAGDLLAVILIGERDREDAELEQAVRASIRIDEEPPSDVPLIFERVD